MAQALPVPTEQNVKGPKDTKGLISSHRTPFGPLGITALAHLPSMARTLQQMVFGPACLLTLEVSQWDGKGLSITLCSSIHSQEGGWGWLLFLIPTSYTFS
jgi:hypothetical protein